MTDTYNIMTTVPTDIVEMIISFTNPPVEYATAHWMVHKLYTSDEWCQLDVAKQKSIQAEFSTHTLDIFGTDDW